MVEIPILNGQSIGKPQRGSIAKEYCEIMQSIFFKERIWNGTPEFTVTYPFGFLLYTNAHPEMRTFMGQEGTWDFLNSLTRKHLYIFSHRPNEAKSAILDTQENAILELFQLFGLGDVPLNPHLVLCDFNFRHTHGMRDWEHKYDAQIKTFYAFKIQHASPEEYTNLFRDTLGVAISRGWNKHAPLSADIAKSLNRSVFVNMLVKAGEGLFRDEFAKKFAAAWTLLNWRPHTIEQPK